MPNGDYPDYGFPEGLGYAPWQLLQALFPYLSMGPNIAAQLALAQFGEQGATGRALISQQGAMQQLAARQAFQSQTQGIQNRFQLAEMMGSGRLRDFMAGRQFMRGGPQPRNAFPGGMGGLYPTPAPMPGMGIPSMGSIGGLFGGIYGGLPPGLQNPASPFDFGGGTPSGGGAPGVFQRYETPPPRKRAPGEFGPPPGFAKGTPGAGFGVWVGEAGPEILKFSDDNEFEGVIPIRGGAQFGLRAEGAAKPRPKPSFGFGGGGFGGTARPAAPLQPFSRAPAAQAAPMFGAAAPFSFPAPQAAMPSPTAGNEVVILPPWEPPQDWPPPGPLPIPEWQQLPTTPWPPQDWPPQDWPSPGPLPGPRPPGPWGPLPSRPQPPEPPLPLPPGGLPLPPEPPHEYTIVDVLRALRLGRSDIAKFIMEMLRNQERRGGGGAPVGNEVVILPPQDWPPQDWPLPIRGGAQFGLQMKQPKAQKPQLSFGGFGAAPGVTGVQAPMFGVQAPAAAPAAPMFGAQPAAPTGLAALPALQAAQTGVMPPPWGPMAPITLEQPAPVYGGPAPYAIPNMTPEQQVLYNRAREQLTVAPGTIGPWRPEYYHMPGGYPEGTFNIPTAVNPMADVQTIADLSELPVGAILHTPTENEILGAGGVGSLGPTTVQIAPGVFAPLEQPEALMRYAATTMPTPEPITIPPPHQAAGLLRGNPVELQDYMDLLTTALGPWAPQWAQWVMQQATPGFRQSGFRGFSF